MAIQHKSVNGISGEGEADDLVVSRTKLHIYK